MRLADLGNYSDLFLRMLDGIVLVDPESDQILDLNDAAERLLDLNDAQALGQKFCQWVSEKSQTEMEQNLRIAKRKYYPRTWDSQWRVGPSELTIQISACILKLSDGREVIQAILRDVTIERENARNLETLNERLKKLSQTDEMTQLFNFRYFKNSLDNEHQRSERYTRAYAIVFIDADHFKHFNDTHGHPAGDGLLRHLAETIKATCRGNDIPARYGGEEFAVVLPETDAEQAMVFAERLRTKIESELYPGGETQPLGKVTVSIGIASFPEHGETSEKILAAADSAVYLAKQAGRNQAKIALSP
jgi:diguanylate cyclase (GGDEF)-like protein/PAS domain S-box-containing protein